jgi:hypothetical protein
MSRDVQLWLEIGIPVFFPIPHIILIPAQRSFSAISAQTPMQI